MTNTDQLAYLALREQQQRAFAARATRPDIIAFHERLAEHYLRLAGDARAITTPYLPFA